MSRSSCFSGIIITSQLDNRLANQRAVHCSATWRDNTFVLVGNLGRFDN